MNITTIGVDLAKNIFQVCGVNKVGKPIFNRQLRRAKLIDFISQYPDSIIAMEACSGSNYWGREFKNRGYEVKLIPPQHVKPFVKGNKNDRNDAFAITEASQRSGIQLVEPRTLLQTDMIQVHRLRERLVTQRTALINQLRGFLSEYGIVVSRGKKRLLAELPEILSATENNLTVAARSLFQEIFTEWQLINKRISEYEATIKSQAKSNEDSKRLMKIRGVAEIIATAVIAHAGNGSAYKNGRHFSANLGLVPKEYSSGGKQKFGGITKRGNSYLRRLLIQGAWSVVQHASKGEDRLSVWAKQVMERRGKQKAVLAVANKMARIIWSMLYHKTEYRKA